jgi:TPR repeat protein
VSIDGAVLAEAKSAVIVAAAPPPPAPEAKTAPASILRAGAPLQQPPERTERPLPSVGASLTAEQRERALRLVKKGDEQLADGGVAQARLLYERAAEAGLALGAMAMAATYDAAELDRLGVLGLKPDREAARRWYERARQLGSAEAEVRLRRLGSN